jgi:hypothetical protein
MSAGHWSPTGRAAGGCSDLGALSFRDPKYSRAERSCVWELVLLAEHVHPSVAAMTKALLAGVSIEYAGDPMRDMSTSAFLDKFVQKKAKARHPKPPGTFWVKMLGTLEVCGIADICRWNNKISSFLVKRW